MATDGSGITDDVRAELNPPPEEAPAQTPHRPQRPADGATKAKWLDYVAALGVDRDFLEGKTEHFDDSVGERVKAKALSREELIELADRLEG
jgi:hypothetical protein